MSKAFTKESDDPGDDGLPMVRPQVPAGVSNYITPSGAQRLREELVELSSRKRQPPGTAAEMSESAQAEQRRLQARIRQLQQILQSVVVAGPPATERERAGFGAIVTVRHAN